MHSCGGASSGRGSSASTASWTTCARPSAGCSIKPDEAAETRLPSERQGCGWRALGYFWYVRGYHTEGVRWLEEPVPRAARDTVGGRGRGRGKGGLGCPHPRVDR